VLRQVAPDAAYAETCLQQAIDVARCRHAKFRQLWAAMSLSRRWQCQGKREVARDLLALV
jgi:hypothetical protein